MTDAELIQLPKLDAKYADFRTSVEWGIANGLVKKPAERQVSEVATQNRRESIKKAQAIRLSKTKVESSRYYGENKT